MVSGSPSTHASCRSPVSSCVCSRRRCGLRPRRPQRLTRSPTFPCSGDLARPCRARAAQLGARDSFRHLSSTGGGSSPTHPAVRIALRRAAPPSTCTCATSRRWDPPLRGVVVRPRGGHNARSRRTVPCSPTSRPLARVVPRRWPRTTRPTTHSGDDAVLSQMMGPSMMGLASARWWGDSLLAPSPYDLPIPPSSTTSLLIVPATFDAFRRRLEPAARRDAAG